MILKSETVFNYLLFSYSQKRLAKEARTQEIQAKNAALGKKIKEPASAKGIKGRGEASFYRVACKVKASIGRNILQCYPMCCIFFFLASVCYPNYHLFKLIVLMLVFNLG